MHLVMEGETKLILNLTDSEKYSVEAQCFVDFGSMGCLCLMWTWRRWVEILFFLFEFQTGSSFLTNTYKEKKQARVKYRSTAVEREHEEIYCPQDLRCHACFSQGGRSPRSGVHSRMTMWARSPQPGEASGDWPAPPPKRAAGRICPLVSSSLVLAFNRP